jgi:hypothetical protein
MLQKNTILLSLQSEGGSCYFCTLNFDCNELSLGWNRVIWKQMIYKGQNSAALKIYVHDDNYDDMT